MRGTRLGRYGADVLAPANKAAAIEHAEQLQPIFAELRGLSANAIARELRKRKVPTARGGKWTATQVINAQRRLAMVA